MGVREHVLVKAEKLYPHELELLHVPADSLAVLGLLPDSAVELEETWKAPDWMLPLLTADPRIPLHLVARVFVGVMPLAGMMGFLTPMLVDRCAGGDPDRAGRAYAVNVVGCIVGPLFSGFILLPRFGEHIATAVLSLPWFVFAWRNGRAPRLQPLGRALAYGAPALALTIFLATKDYETQFPVRAVFRDSTATVIARGTGMQRRLLVNGMGMTKLTPITKTADGVYAGVSVGSGEARTASNS